MSRSIPPLKIYRVDNGFSSIVYSGKNHKGERIYYAITAWKGKCSVYRASHDGEPQWDASFKRPLKDLFELPTGAEELCKTVRDFLINK